MGFDRLSLSKRIDFGREAVRFPFETIPLSVVVVGIALISEELMDVIVTKLGRRRVSYHVYRARLGRSIL